MKNRLYRSPSGAIFGVCQGLSERFELSVFWIRFGVALAAITTALFPVALIYAIAAIFMPLRPKRQGWEQDEAVYDEDYFDVGDASPRELGLRRLKSKFDAIESRIRRMESYVTDRSHDWERRFHSGK